MKRLPINKVEKITVDVKAADILREAIVTGLLPAGERITEHQIATEIGVSRATVRAALHQLAEEGLLVLVPYTGWTVVSLSSKDVWELYTLRAAVERLAARLLAASLTAEGAVQLNATFCNLVDVCKSDDRFNIAKADFAFHRTIIRLCNHDRLSAQYILIEQQVRMFIRLSNSLIFDPIWILSQHAPMLESIVAGNINESGNKAEEHNITEGEKLFAFVKEVEIMSK